MRTITVSTPTFAAIWAIREAGEQTEDEILRRVLKVTEDAPAELVAPTKLINPGNGGFFAKRYNVHFPEGFEIHRTFKGKDYKAVATNGSWTLVGTEERFKNLADLSYGIGTKIENVWKNWLFTDSDGTEKQISDLRDPSTISTRKS